MARRLREALAGTPLFFEPAPPPARGSPARAAATVEAIVGLVTSIPRIDAVDVPELVDENHEGRPLYRSADPRAFARTIGERTHREVLVNKVVAHLASVLDVERWAEETVGLGVHHVVLVGGTSRYIPYPGPSVTEADRICRPIVERHGGLVGNIAIPQREGEPHRMLSKTRAGATFFTTQIVFDADATGRLLQQYDLLCRQASLPAAPVLVSTAPLVDEQDAEFVRWLGADVPEAAERAILEGDETGAAERSVARSLEVWDEVVERTERAGLEVPLGVNVEQISARHLEHARAMAAAFADHLGG
ncbi:MAG TPA: hypothetical protein VEL82_02715 [Thermoplasmata archaeon]|nr:hypothetical protein [Thermoplasmata archaeon]